MKSNIWYFNGPYACRQIWRDGKAITLYMHRVIMGNPVNLEVDHINGNGLDNRRRNLLSVTHRQNMANQKASKNSSSQYKGVSWEKRRNQWQAYIETKGRKKHLGYFSNEIEAAQAYDVSAQKIFGEFARTNFETYDSMHKLR